MSAKAYTALEEIDNDLKILRLQREIAEENLKLSCARARERLYPRLLPGGVPGILKKVLISITAKKILNRRGRQRLPGH